MLHSRSTKPAAKSPAMRSPYGVGFRVPTIASDLSDSTDRSPLTTNPIGVVLRSFNDVGHSKVLGIMKTDPAFSRMSSISSMFTDLTRSINLRYLTGS